MFYRVAYYIYLGSLVFASLAGILRFAKADSASRVFSVLICSALINETLAIYLARKFHNNLVLYSFYSILEFGALCVYFNKVIDIFIRKNLGLYIAAIGIALGIANMLFLQPIPSFNSYFLLFEGLAVIGMSLLAFFRLLLHFDSLNLYRYHHFWFMSVLVFFWSITFLTWGLYNYINVTLQQSAWKINTGLAIIATITYSSFGIIFLLYPKMQSSHE